MFRRAIRVVCMLMLVLIFMVPGLQVFAQDDYPNRPIKATIGWPPGEPADLGVRFHADKWAEFLGQPVVIINKPGASGALAARSIANEKPDGYNLLVIGDSTVLNSRLERKDAGFDLETFRYVFYYGEIAFFYSVKSDSKWKTLNDFLRDAKNNPGKLKYGCLGPNNALVMATNILSDIAGVKLTYVPFKSGSDALTSVIGGTIDMAVTWGLLGVGKSPMIRPLAVSREERVPDCPNVPTLKELGYDLKYTGSQSGLAAPRNTPDKVLAKLKEAHGKVRVKYAKELQDSLSNLGQYSTYMDGNLIFNRLQEKEKLFKKFYEQIGFKPQ